LKKRYEINILGQSLSVLHGSGDDYVENVIRYVKDRMQEVERSSGGINTLSIAILAALNIADDFFKLKEAKDSIYNQMEIKSEGLIKILNGISRSENPCDVRD